MSASCRHVPEASELNGENGSCLEVLKQIVLLGGTKVELDCRLLAALLPEAQLSLCASVLVLCGRGVTEQGTQPKTHVCRRWIVAETPRDTPERRAAQQAMEGGGERRRRRTYTIAMDEKRN